MVVVSVAAVPLALVAIRALARRRAARGVPVGEACRNTAAEVGMTAGTLPWLWMILTPIPAPREVEPIPLVDLAGQLQGTPVTAFFQVGGNLLVLSAFGFFAPLRWRIGLASVVAIAAAGSLTVEILQFWIALGRVSSVDDVLLNAVGAGLAALASRRWWAGAWPTSRRRAASRHRSTPTACAATGSASVR